MQLSANGTQFIKNAEGLRLSVYLCSASKLTIGFGHKLLPNEVQFYTRIKPVITREDADKLFDQDAQKYVNALKAALSESPSKLNQNQFDALVAFIFNIGIGAWNGSTARRDLVGGKLSLIPAELKRWCHIDHGVVCPGLKNRRDKEIALFNKAVA